MLLSEFSDIDVEHIKSHSGMSTGSHIHAHTIVWSGELQLQHMEITLDGLIWDLGVFNYGYGYV